MKVLVACEFSGIVREAFRKEGHDAWSCDLLPSEIEGQHVQGDVKPLLKQLHSGFDLLISFIPCTYLCVSGARWMINNPKRQKLQLESIEFAKMVLNAPIKYIALENPIGVLSTKLRKPDQIIQPWMFGHGETKATCLWLKNLPKLEPTNIVPGREARIHKMAPSPNRGMERSRTYMGIAQAMAEQWGSLELKTGKYQ